MASNSPPSPDNTGKATSGTVPANAAAPGASAAAPETKANAGAPAKSGGEPNGRTATRRTSAAKTSAHDNSAHAKKSDGEAVAMLKQDHRRVEKLFAEYEKAGDDRKDAIIQDVCHALTLHTMLEEEVFYPACRNAARDEDPLDEAQVEHDSAKVLIADLARAGREDPFRDAKVKVLAEQILHHVKEEEGDDGIFVRAGKAGVDTPELAAQLKELRSELEAEDRLPPQAPVSFGASPRAEARNTQERTMASYQGRDNGSRDDRGRFAGQGGRYREDDDRRGSRSSQDRPRDEEGRFMSDDRGRSSRGHDDDRDYRGRSSSSRDDDRGGRSGNRGHGGWFGDSEEHSQASRKGWERSDHEGSGWYGDSRGHSEASHRGWENSDHEGSGWYGDPRGNSEASRRGWDDRDRSSRSSSSGRHDDDDRRSRYSRDDDDDRGGRRGGRDDDRGHGGWFGDSRGHSEASRRGWDNRH